MGDEPKIKATRTFLRSFQILLKSARMYGLEHTRTTSQLEVAWDDLRSAMPPEGQSGLIVGVSGSQLLLDGTPLEANPAERTFAELLAAGGLASIYFSPQVNLQDFACFVRAFAAGAGKGAALADQLKLALGETPSATIHINEIRYVPEDGAHSTSGAASSMVADSLGVDAFEVQRWFTDPIKLLQLLAAAEGARSDSTALGPGEKGSVGAIVEHFPSGSAAGTATLSSNEEDVLDALRLLAKLGQVSGTTSSFAAGDLVQVELPRLPPSTKVTLHQALNSLAAISPSARPDTPMLLQLAEHLAIRFALERYERGDVRVNAVREMLARMGREIDTLRKVLSAREEKLRGAGLGVESHAEVLDRQFWAALPETVKRSVLLSPEAWCISPRNVGSFAEQSLQSGHTQLTAEILRNYAACVQAADPEARQSVARGLTELAKLYGRIDGGLLGSAIALLCEQLSKESMADARSLVGEALVRLSQEAADRQDFSSLSRVFSTLEHLERCQPELAREFWQKLRMDDRVSTLLEIALRAPDIPTELVEILKRVPRCVVEQAGGRMIRCLRARERDRLVELAQALGPQAARHLREVLQTRPAAESVTTVGLLARLDSAALEELLPVRLREWSRAHHDAVVRQLACSGALGRGRLLANLLGSLDLLVLPEALDEIGMSGERSAGPLLIELASGKQPRIRSAYLRLKAIEALGRLREREAVLLLRDIIEARQLWRWLHPQELRIAAAQSLLKIDSQEAQNILPRSDLGPDDLALVPFDAVPEVTRVRQRLYPRVRLTHPLDALAVIPRGNYHFAVTDLSLGGGLALGGQIPSPGTVAPIEFKVSRGNLRAQVVFRDPRGKQHPFEVVDIDLEDRLRLRRLLFRN